MSAHHVVGLDPSLTHTAGHQMSDRLLSPMSSRPFAIKAELSRFAHPVARLQRIARDLDAELAMCESIAGGPGLMCVEGYAFGAMNQREALGEWGGQVRRIAYERGWRLLIVPPTTLKKYVTGKGVAEKDMMMLEVLDRWGYKPTDNNDADAYALGRLGVEYLGWERGEPTTKRVAELFAVTPKQPKTEKKKAQKQKGLAVWEPAHVGVPL